MGTTISGDTGVVFPDATTQSTAVTVATPFSINASAGAGAQLRLPEATANGVNYVAVKAPDLLAGNVTWTLPAADGTSGQFLQTNGSGQLAFAGLSSPLEVVGNSTAGAEIRLPEDTDNGSNYVAIKAPNSLAANLTFTLPSADGTSGQVLVTNGSGTLSFSSSSASDVQEFTSSGTWTKPAGAKIVIVEIIGAGGGGGSGVLTSSNAYIGGGAGGGGGSYVSRTFNASALGATESVTIGAGGAGGAARIVDGQSGLAGSTGGNSTFGSWATAYGGSGGGRGEFGGGVAYGGYGAGNGGSNQAIGWLFTSSTYGYGVGAGGIGGGNYRDTPNSSGEAKGGSAEYGGGGGGSSRGVSTTYYTGTGGGSLFAGPGGGAGGSCYGSNPFNPANGGAYGTISNGTGGSAGISQATPTAGSAGSLTTGFFAGSGGGGGGASTTGAGAAGGNGARGAGGGGGGGGYVTSSGAGGSGGNGYCRVITLF